MYSIDDLLHLASSDGADELRLHVGTPPVIVLGGVLHTIEGPPITTENAGATAAKCGHHKAEARA